MRGKGQNKMCCVLEILITFEYEVGWRHKGEKSHILLSCLLPSKKDRTVMSSPTYQLSNYNKKWEVKIVFFRLKLGRMKAQRGKKLLLLSCLLPSKKRQNSHELSNIPTFQMWRITSKHTSWGHFYKVRFNQYQNR